MPAIKLEQFGGQLPAWDDTLLPNGQASECINGYMFSGVLTGWRMPTLLRTLTNPNAGFAYRVPTVSKGFAHNTLTFTSVPLVNDSVKIGELTYKFVNTLVDAFDVLIGADINSAANNLYEAITVAHEQAGVTYGEGTYTNRALDNSEPSLNVLTPGANPTIYIQAPDPGDAYNGQTTTVVTGGARMFFATATLEGGSNPSFNSDITGPAVWLEYEDPDTQVMRSPVVDDKFDRYYVSSPTTPPQYNTYDRIVSGDDPWLLGIDPPGASPELTVTGGGNQELLGLPTSTSSNTVIPNTNTIWVMPVTADGAQALLSCEIMPASPSDTAQFAAVLYADNGGVPGNLLNTGAIVTGCVTGVPILSAFANPSSLSDDTQYWIGFMTDSGVAFQLADDLGTAGVLKQTNTWTNGPPQIFSGNTAMGDVQMWGNSETSSVLETRAYTYTWLSAYDEEGPPAVPTLLNGWSNGTWEVQLGTPPPDDMGVLRNITKARIYRTVSGVGGSTVFFWVGDITIASNEVEHTDELDPEVDGNLVASGPMKVADTLADSVVSANFQMPSTNWYPPPRGLQNIIAMPNGMAVGFRNNEVWFSEPYRPHAWPPGYVLTTEFPIKGLGVVGLSVIICTDGTPYVASGANPADMSMLKLPEAAPCISGSSIVPTSDGVYYASPKGLINVVPAGQAKTTTEMWITRDKWTQITPQKNLRAVLQQSCYYCFGTVNGDDRSVAQQGYTIELSTLDSSSFTIWPQPGGHRIGFSKLSAPNSVDIVNVFNDPWTGTTCLIQGGQIFYHDFDDASPVIQPYSWTSKQFQQKNKVNMAAMRVFYDTPASTPTQNATRNTAAKDDASWNTLQTGQHGIIFIYGDDELLTVRELRRSAELLRIESGQKYEYWQIKIVGRVNVTNVQLATSVKDLRSV